MLAAAPDTHTGNYFTSKRPTVLIARRGCVFDGGAVGGGAATAPITTAGTRLRPFMGGERGREMRAPGK